MKVFCAFDRKHCRSWMWTTMYRSNASSMRPRLPSLIVIPGSSLTTAPRYFAKLLQLMDGRTNHSSRHLIGCENLRSKNGLSRHPSR
jgi:hypothetical protein